MYRLPCTWVPAGPVGVIVTMIVPLWPGLSTSGPGSAAGLALVPALARLGASNRSPAALASAACAGMAAGSTPTCQKSPVSLVTAGSNRLPKALADTVSEPAGAPLGNGPDCPMSVSHRPGETCGAFTVTVAPLPTAAEYRSGLPLW